MMNKSNISCELLRTLAEDAYDRGDGSRTLELTHCVDQMMLEALQHSEGRQVGANEVSTVMPANGA